MFAIAMLAWYAWYESRARLSLAAFYIFVALGTLAKGPVAPFLAGAILLIFAALKRDWRILLRTLWIPGILLFLAVALPWYFAVQFRNPEFFRTFILEHNLARFGQDLYHHRQPFWFYLPVLLLSLMPWTLWAVAAAAECLRLVWSEGKNAFSSDEDSWQLFLLIWLLVPVLFFSASQSKLPGYILPAIPAGALLVSDYLAIRRDREAKIWPWLAGLHAALCGLLVFGALAAPGIVLNHHLVWGTGSYIAAAVAAVVTLGVAAALLSRAGLRWLRFATMVPIVVGVGAILRLASPMVDATLSARPIAQTIQSFSQETGPDRRVPHQSRAGVRLGVLSEPWRAALRVGPGAAGRPRAHHRAQHRRTSDRLSARPQSLAPNHHPYPETGRLLGSSDADRRTLRAKS